MRTKYRYDQNDRLLEERFDADGNGTVDQTTLYGYTGTQQTGKDVHTGDSDAAVTSSTVFTYNLQGRMNSVTIETYQNGSVTRRETNSYAYNTLGIRTSAERVVAEDTDQDPDTALVRTSHTRTEYLNDPHNPTGYSQVLQETEFDAEGDIVKRTIYTLGHDQLSQTTYVYTDGVADAGTTLFFGSDGHGSTRVLFDAAGAIADVGGLQIFHFDAYGNAIGFDPAVAATSILYSGEMFDVNTGLQYLRARYYNPATGTFNRLDPFSGNINDPQSFHKYLYAQADPVTNIDPSGTITLGGVATAVGQGLRLASIGIRIADSVMATVNTIQTTAALYQLFFAGGFDQIRTAVETVFKQWEPIPSASGTQRLLTQHFWVDALSVLRRNSSKIVARVTAQHGRSLVSRFANNVTSFTWLVFMPTPDNGERSPLDLTIPNPQFRVPFPVVRIAGKPVALQFGGGGGQNRGRVFGLGIGNLKKTIVTNQYFRMDYHIPHGKGKNDAYYWESGGSTQRFHFQIPR